MEIPIGSTVGGYVLEQRLGVGAMGSVYRARHRSLPKDVAIKVLHPAFLEVPEFRVRFEREAEVLSRLDDPTIVEVIDRGLDGNLLWMATRLVDGPDLARALAARGPFPVEQAIAVVGAVGQALDHAHARGLLHRDVKPANILLRTDTAGVERAMLTDFGIAKDLTATHPLTSQDQRPGTYAYSAPEQLAGHDLDPRVDVYALGAVLFELLTGQRAFPQDELPSLLWAKMQGPVPDLGALRPDLPPALAGLVGRALAQDRAARFGSCAELVAEARDAVSAPPRAPAATPAPVPPPGPVAGRAPATVLTPQSPADGPTVRGTLPAPPAAVPPRPRRRRRRFAAAATGTVVVSALVSVLVIVLAMEGGSRGTAGDSPAAVGTSASSVAPGVVASADGGTGTALTVGTCLDGAGATVPCDGRHSAEVFGTATGCSTDGLLSYLGGVPTSDVLRDDLAVASVPQSNGVACTVTGPDGPLTTSSKDALASSRGDVWRRCLDQVLAREVSCSQPHTAEVIFDRGSGTGPLSCGSRADAYLGTPFQQHAEDLRLTDDGSRCLIEVRGDNVLSASLRRLGANALPLEARPQN